MFGFTYGFIFIIMIVIILFMNSLRNIMFESSNIKNRNKRLNKLRFDDEDLNISKLKDIITKTTTPFMFLIPVSYKNNIALEKKLKIIEWDKYFTANEFLVLVWLLRFVSVILFFILGAKSSWIEGFVGIILLGFAPMFLLNNEYNETKKRILSGFPSVIRNLSCFLNADMSFVSAIRNTLNYTKNIWAVLLEEFANDCEVYSYEVAIENICSKLDIWEITDFFNMVNLSLQKGINLRESFDIQSERIDVLYRQSILEIINKRENAASLIQAPMLIGVILAFAIPIVQQFTQFTSISF